MKHRVSEIDGYLLDAAVAKAEWPDAPIRFAPSNGSSGIACWVYGKVHAGVWTLFCPTQMWQFSLSIIEREKISMIFDGVCWVGTYAEVNYMLPKQEASTPLMAALRAFVQRRLGDEIELPEPSFDLPGPTMV